MENIEIYAIVELFGHQRMAGKVSEQNIAGANMVRIDVPETKTAPAFTRFLNPSAIYAINPVTKEVADGMAEQIQVKPIDMWDAREVLSRIDKQKQLNVAQEKNPEYIGEDQ